MLATSLGQCPGLLPNLDPFRDCYKVKGLGHAGNTLNDGHGFGILDNIDGKRSIELEYVNGQAAKVADVGIATAEIVKRDSNPTPGQFTHLRSRQIKIGKLTLLR